MGTLALTLGSSFQLLVDVILLLLFRSFNQKVSRVHVFVAILSLILYWSFYDHEDYIHRTIISISALLLLSIWQIVELTRSLKKSWSIYLLFLIAMIAIQILFAGIRLHEGISLLPLHGTSAAPVSRFEENLTTFMERLPILICYILLLMGVGNHFFDRLYQQAYKHHHELEEQIVTVLTKLAAARDNNTGKHNIRTQTMMRVLANSLKAMGYYKEELTPEKIKNMYLAAPLHDVGKVAISDEILLKPGKLSEDERVMVRKHVTLGEEILGAAASAEHNPIIDTALRLASSHHEQWDGKGYPRGLKELEIPLEGRIMAVVDVYDALSTKRIYKDGWKHEEVVEYIVKNAGIQFDPIVVEAFLLVKDQFQKIAEDMHDPDIGVTPLR